jgi:2-polyprenyl-6-methoxyphenol hydroxylase-like FAD-dependent oxidoreductase
VADVDVVVIGGGIAGGALASVLAAGGSAVIVLERQVEFRDRVRGENMQPWGVVELRRLGLEDVLLAAGGGYCSRVVPYDENRSPTDAEAFPLPLDIMAPGVPGSFNVGHPDACEALLRHAADSGARVMRGIGDVDVVPGPRPSVRYELDGTTHEVHPRVVIGADGRQSVVRRQMGIELVQVESKALLGGLLVRDEQWPADVEVLGTEGHVHFLVFPRPGGQVRLYLAVDKGSDVGGTDRTQRFLRSFQLDCFPAGDSLSRAEPIGPCAYYPGSDSWCERPFGDGVVLVGDAAGWSDPIIGQGLSVALRDARQVADVLLADDTSMAAFEPYAVERAERMSRLRVSGSLTTELRCTFTPAGRERRQAVFAQMMSDPGILGVMVAPLAGPDSVPADVFTTDNIERILALT